MLSGANQAACRWRERTRDHACLQNRIYSSNYLLCLIKERINAKKNRYLIQVSYPQNHCTMVTYSYIRSSSNCTEFQLNQPNIPFPFQKKKTRGDYCSSQVKDPASVSSTVNWMHTYYSIHSIGGNYYYSVGTRKDPHPHPQRIRKYGWTARDNASRNPIQGVKSTLGWDCTKSMAWNPPHY